MFLPFGDYVVVKPLPSGSTEAGIALPSTVKDEDAMRGTIVAAGEDVKDEIKKVANDLNDPVVLFKQYSATTFTYDRQKYYIVESKNILSIFKNK